ncbi:DUF4270 family protein [Spirosoma validum]|uniref:DUF4270 family protein n=1 Tax=Spirosoma validum TaxID=2771355 RepID=A0A927B238_9BACT|nr:DUF4270 family protein [Spirosoma validum]MBD2753990.1 DUF4270 family protein [Spirosoma validum]
MRTFWYAGLLLLTGIVLVACQSGDLNVGQSVINPQELSIQSIDTVTIQTSTVLRADSFATSTDADIVVGRWTDPQTGRLNARSFATFDYTSNSLGAQTNLRLDSLVLEMNYSLVSASQAFVYGDTTTLFDISVHRLANPLAPQLYYNTSSIVYDPTPTAKMVVLPQPNRRGKQIRFRMTDNLAQDLFTRLSTNQITDFTSLSRFIPGFAFVNNSTSNTLACFATSTSGLRLYYHTIEDPQTSADVLFPITNYHFTQLQNDRSGTPLNALKNRSDAVSSRLTDNTSFVSIASQLQTRIEFPYLAQFARPEGYADLNKAVLVVSPIRRTQLDNAAPPSSLELFQVNNQNVAIATIPGGTIPQSGGGALGYYSIDPFAQLFTDSYTFDLTYYIGEILKQKAPNEPLLLTLPAPTSQDPYTLKRFIQRVTLGNPFRTGDQMKMKLFISSGT